MTMHNNPPVAPKRADTVVALSAGALRDGVGPTGPQRSVPAPDTADLLPVAPLRGTAALWCLGVHGGAGESTLAALDASWREAGHAWPAAPLQRSAPPVSVLLVARSSLRGLTAAQSAAQQWAAGLVPWSTVVGLVIVADAPGRLPRPLRDLAQLVAGGVPRTWHLPWIESCRLSEGLALPAAPREVRRFVDQVSALIKPGAVGTANRKEPS